MPKFFYTARNKSGQRSTGAEEASGLEEAVTKLQSRGLIVVTILPEFKEEAKRQDVPSEAKFRIKTSHYRIKGDDLVLFCRQLATLLGTGVTILRSLEIISQQVSSRRLYDTIKGLQKNMESGLSFHEAMVKEKGVFSDLWINLVESGEASGNLAVILSRLANYLERTAAFKRKIISSLMYPAILFVVGSGALFFLTIKIIPSFMELFKGFDVDLPPLTKGLVLVSDFIRGNILKMIVAVIIGFFILRKYLRTKNGRRAFEKLLFNLPIFGEFFRATVVERFTAEMATLVESGVPILYSLEITEHSVDNLVLGDVIRQIKEEVREGRPLQQPLEKSGFFSPMVVQMINIGEEIGELSNMFKRLNTYYEEYVDTFLIRFTALFEPIMLIFMGVVVAIMVIGVFLPIFQIAKLH